MFSMVALMPISFRLAWITSPARFLVSSEQMMAGLDGGRIHTGLIQPFLAFATSYVSAFSSVAPAKFMGIWDRAGVAHAVQGHGDNAFFVDGGVDGVTDILVVQAGLLVVQHQPVYAGVLVLDDCPDPDSPSDGRRPWLSTSTMKSTSPASRAMVREEPSGMIFQVMFLIAGAPPK